MRLRDEDDELLQFAIQQSLLEPGAGAEQVGVSCMCWWVCYLLLTIILLYFVSVSASNPHSAFFVFWKKSA